MNVSPGGQHPIGHGSGRPWSHSTTAGGLRKDEEDDVRGWLEGLPHLAPAERRFLRALVAAPGRSLGYRELFTALAPGEEALARAFDAPLSDRRRASLVGRIHQAARGIRQHLPPEARLENVRGIGYLLVSRGDLRGDRAAGGPLAGAIPAAPSPPGAPPERGLDALLSAAASLAGALGQDYVGLEHLVLALIDLPGGGAVTAYVRGGARLEEGELRRRLGALQLKVLAMEARPGPPSFTPRLGGILAALPPDAGLEALWRRVCEDPYQPLALVGGGVGTLGAADAPTYGRQRTLGPPRSAMVVLGPEDGRGIPLREGTELGRAGAEAAGRIGLYEGCRFTDQAVSRRHVGWLGGGRIALHAACVLQRGPLRMPLAVGEEGTVGVGDVLWLSSHSAIRFLEGPSDEPCGPPERS